VEQNSFRWIPVPFSRGDTVRRTPVLGRAACQGGKAASPVTLPYPKTAREQSVAGAKKQSKLATQNAAF
jgi:hypothetical protein